VQIYYRAISARPAADAPAAGRLLWEPAVVIQKKKKKTKQETTGRAPSGAVDDIAGVLDGW
jgi:hypothetical protein